jgi:signal transduction histidine kinase
MLDLLDLAQLETRTLRINNEYFDLEKTVDEAFMILYHISDLKSISFEKIIEIDKEMFFR